MSNTRARKGLLAGLTVLGMGTLSLVGIAPAMAAPGTGTEANPAQAAITKDFQLPEGVDTPNAAFNFVITGVDWDGQGDTQVPMLGSANPAAVTYTSADTAAPTSGVVSITKETGDLLSGVAWPGPGIFEYTVKEAPNTNTLGAGESITYSDAEYTLYITVENCAAGTPCEGGTYVKAVGAEKIIEDDGTPNPSPGKVDPTPGGGTGGVGGTSALTFVNTYAKTGGGDPTDPADAALASVSKAVTGTGASTTQYFDFDVTVTKPAVGVTGTPTYNAYVVDAATGAEVAVADNGNGGNPISLTSGVSSTIKLKDGQKLVVPDAQIGATYTVTEAAANRYTPSVDVTTGGASAVNTTGTENTALSTGPIVISDAGANAADYINAYAPVTPTGVFVDVLPYLLVGAVAVAGLAVVVVGTVRKQRA